VSKFLLTLAITVSFTIAGFRLAAVIPSLTFDLMYLSLVAIGFGLTVVEFVAMVKFWPAKGDLRHVGGFDRFERDMHRNIHFTRRNRDYGIAKHVN